MKPITLGKICLVLVVVVTVMWLVYIWINSENTATSPSTADINVDQKNIQQTPSVSIDAVETETLDCTDLRAELNVRVACFIENWYLLEPSDTTETVRSRISPYLHGSFEGIERLNVTTWSRADKARIEQKITVHARLVGEPVAEPFDSENPDDLIEVGATALRWSEDSADEQLLETTTSMWAKVNGSWLVVQFEEVGDTG